MKKETAVRQNYANATGNPPSVPVSKGGSAGFAKGGSTGKAPSGKGGKAPKK